MFWRIIRRLLGANRGRLFVILLALGAGSAVTAALLNLQVDAKRRLTTEFRAFGANVIIAPRDETNLNESILDRLPRTSDGNRVLLSGLLYVAADAVAVQNGAVKKPGNTFRAVVVGYSSDIIFTITPSTHTESSILAIDHVPSCSLGEHVATQLDIHAGSPLLVTNGFQREECFVSAINNFGGPEDNQILTDLRDAQRLANLPSQISLVQVSVPGTPRQIEKYISMLQKQLPEVDVRPIRQFTEGEAKIYSRISGLLTATVAIVLVFTGLCVMAAMTNVAMERKMDVGLMKAVGGSMRRVLRLFLAEAALLGLIGGVIGAALGMILSMGLGKAVFGVAARPRLIVYPVAVVLTMIVAILSAYPLRRLASIRPASVFRGEA
jgi:putative ABC transport system permease protein